jgi:hypothetical protein
MTVAPTNEPNQRTCQLQCFREYFHVSHFNLRRVPKILTIFHSLNFALRSTIEPTEVPTLAPVESETPTVEPTLAPATETEEP